MCLHGQGSEVHWNLLRNLFVKTIIIAIFLQNYILENCILSIKVLLYKLVQALLVGLDWLACVLTLCVRLLSQVPRTWGVPGSAAPSARLLYGRTVGVQRAKEKAGSSKKGRGSWRWWRFPRLSWVVGAIMTEFSLTLLSVVYLLPFFHFRLRYNYESPTTKHPWALVRCETLVWRQIKNIKK